MRALSIYPDPKGRADLERALGQRVDVHLCRSFDHFPDAETLARSVRAWDPSLIFLDITHPAAEAVNALLIAQFPDVRRVGIHPAQLPDVFRRVLRLGMCELVNPPFKMPQLGPVLDRIVEDLSKNPRQNNGNCRISAFMPVKAGVGASTVAAHVSWAAAQNPEARVLLVDFDRYSGITAFQFNVDTDYTVQDALNNSMELDEDSWRTLVRSVKNVDLLVSRPGELTETDTERHIAPMMKFAQRNYTAIHADLPDTFDAHSLSVLRQADQIYIVTTSELPSLRLAKLKVETLRKLELEGRTHLVLNRQNHRLGLSTEEIQKVVGMEVYESFPCDYEGVSQSLHKALPAPKMMQAAEKFLARSSDYKKPAGYRTKFIERFSLTLPALRPGMRVNAAR